MSKIGVTIIFSLLSGFIFGQLPGHDWVKAAGGAGDDFGNSVKVDSRGYVYSVGTFDGIVDFDPGTGVHLLNSGRNNDLFIQKLDSSGNFIWAISIGVGALVHGNSMAIDVKGNLLVTGQFAGTADFDPSMSVYNLTSKTGYSSYVLKLDSNGKFIWARLLTSNGSLYTSSIATNKEGSVFTTGHYTLTADFDPGSGAYSVKSEGWTDTFIQKLDSNGNFEWAKTMGGPSNSTGTAITVDNHGNIYSTGNFRDTMDFNLGSTPIYRIANGGDACFLQKLDSNGKLIWVNQTGGGGTIYGLGITTEADGDVYLTGQFQNRVDFDPGVGTHFILSNGSQDIYVQKLDSNGVFIWVKTAGGKGKDRSNCVVTDVLGNVYLSGDFDKTVDFNSGSGNNTLISRGGPDAYVLKLDENGNFIWVSSMGGVGGANGVRSASLFIDSDGFLYSTGTFVGTTDFDPGIGRDTLTPNGRIDFFVHKMNQNLSARIVESNVTCNGLADGNAHVLAVGGKKPYTYMWDNSDTTSSISGLLAGTYNLTISDSDTSTLILTVVITEPKLLVIDAIIDSMVNCKNDSNGVAHINVRGGTSPYNYSWSNLDSTDTIIGLIAKVYYVSVTDSQACLTVDSAVILEPALLIASAFVDSSVSCIGLSDGIIHVSSKGGTLPYSYLWSNGSAIEKIIGVPIDNYFVTVTDSNGCSDSASIFVSDSRTPCVGVDEKTAEPQVDFYPNPNYGKVFFSATGLSGKVRLTIIDHLGQSIKSFTWEENASFQDLSISIPILKSGVYLFIIEDNRNKIIRRISILN